MDPTLATLGAAVMGGLLVGFLARPISWRLFSGVLVLAGIFVVLELWNASRRATSIEELLAIVSLSAAPEFHRHYGAMAIAYGAVLGAAVIAGRILIAKRKKARHES